MNINLIWDSSVSGAPAGFEADIQAAAQILDNLFSNNVTINLEVGYGEITQNGTTTTVSPQGGLGGPDNGSSFTYAQVRSDLVAQHPNLANSLPTSDPTGGGSIIVWYGEEQALGLVSANGGTVAGSIGIGTGEAAGSANTVIASALHELTHAMGRVEGFQNGGTFDYSALDLYRYSAVGTFQFNNAQAAYFSLNGGVTNLGNYDTTSDPSDWAANSSDPFDAVFITNTVLPTLSQVDRLEMQALGFTPNADSSDFSGDGYSDILFQNSSGQAATWLMNGATVTGGGLIGANPGPSWQLKATGDFNGDGDSDILWQNTDGTVAIWEMNGTSVIGGGLVGSNPGPSWQIKGTGDFNGDGNRDILWQATDGTVAIWELNGTSVIGGGLVGSNPGASWHVIGTGDFNGDGKSDILFQNTDGTVAVWLMNGTSVIGGALVGSNPGPSWHVIGAGDFNGDGKSDILLQNDSGQAAIWLMNGTTNTGGGLVGANPGPSWHVIGSSDYNGDGKSDFLWQNSDGTPAVWLMNGTSVIGGGIPGSSNPGTSWHVITAGS